MLLLPLLLSRAAAVASPIFVTDVCIVVHSTGVVSVASVDAAGGGAVISVFVVAVVVGIAVF